VHSCRCSVRIRQGAEQAQATKTSGLACGLRARLAEQPGGQLYIRKGDGRGGGPKRGARGSKRKKRREGQGKNKARKQREEQEVDRSLGRSLVACPVRPKLTEASDEEALLGSSARLRATQRQSSDVLNIFFCSPYLGTTDGLPQWGQVITSESECRVPPASCAFCSAFCSCTPFRPTGSMRDSSSEDSDAL